MYGASLGEDSQPSNLSRHTVRDGLGASVIAPGPLRPLHIIHLLLEAISLPSLATGLFPTFPSDGVWLTSCKGWVLKSIYKRFRKCSQIYPQQPLRKAPP